MQNIILVFLALGFATIQVGIGGAKLLYSLPAYALLAVAACSCVLARTNQISIGIRTSCLISTVTLAAYIGVRNYYSPWEYLARPDHFMTIAALAVYLVSALFLSLPNYRILVINILLALATVHVICGAIQFKEGKEFMLLGPWIIRTPAAWRASGFYICPNHLAGLLEALGMMALGLVCWSRSKLWLRLSLGYGVLLCFAGVAITGSRGGYLSTLCGLILFAVLSLSVIHRVKRRSFWRMVTLSGMLFILLVGGGIAVMAKSDLLKKRMAEVYDPQNMRLYMWEASLKQFHLNPIFGTGSGTYLYYGRHFRSQDVQRDPMHVHNDYLELLCEYGIIGALAMAAFLGAHLSAGITGMRRIVRYKLEPTRRIYSNELALVIGALSAIGALMVHSIVDFNLHIPANTLVIAFLLSILSAPTNDAGRAASVETATLIAKSLRWLAPVAGIYLIVFGLPLIRAEYYAERARVSLRDGDYTGAVSYAEQAVATERKNPDIYFYLAESKHFLALDQNLPASERDRLGIETIAALKAGLDLFPKDLRLLLKLGRTYDQLGRFDDGDLIFERAVDADPNFTNTYAYLGFHLQLQGKLRAAETEYKKALSIAKEGNPLAAAGLRDIEQERKRLKAIQPFDVSDDEDEMDEQADAAADGERVSRPK